MKTFLRTLALASVAAISLAVLNCGQAKADDYWVNHWNWYDNTYQPYYYRNYVAGPGYTTFYGPTYPGYYSGYYGPGYYSAPGYYGGVYGYGGPYRTYYGTGPVGYGRVYGQAINVGPLSFGWR